MCLGTYVSAQKNSQWKEEHAIYIYDMKEKNMKCAWILLYKWRKDTQWSKQTCYKSDMKEKKKI